LESLETSLALRPNQATGWFHKGQIMVRLKRPEEGASCYRRALEIDPKHERAYLALGESLQAQEKEEARRYLRRGLRNLPASKALEEALRALDDSSSPPPPGEVSP